MGLGFKVGRTRIRAGSGIKDWGWVKLGLGLVQGFRIGGG